MLSKSASVTLLDFVTSKTKEIEELSKWVFLQFLVHFVADDSLISPSARFFYVFSLSYWSSGRYSMEKTSKNLFPDVILVRLKERFRRQARGEGCRCRRQRTWGRGSRWRRSLNSRRSRQHRRWTTSTKKRLTASTVSKISHTIRRSCSRRKDRTWQDWRTRWRSRQSCNGSSHGSHDIRSHRCRISLRSRSRWSWSTSSSPIVLSIGCCGCSSKHVGCEVRVCVWPCQGHPLPLVLHSPILEPDLKWNHSGWLEIVNVSSRK